MPLYDFGVDPGQYREDELIPVSWPITVWRCIVPENIVPDDNILEQLVLRVIDKGIASTDTEIKKILGAVLSDGTNESDMRELIKNVIEHCESQGRFDQRFGSRADTAEGKKRVLNAETKKLVKRYQQQFSMDMELCKNQRTVLLLEDGVSCRAIPCFRYTELPVNTIPFNQEQTLVFEPKRKKSHPSIASINSAIKSWERYRIALDQNESCTPVIVSLKESLQEDADEEEDMFGGKMEPDEVVKPDEAPVENRDKLSMVTILDDEARWVDALGYVIPAREDPKSPAWMSPFGSPYNEWSGIRAARYLAQAPKTQEKLDRMLDEKSRQMADVIAYDNALDVALFNEYPAVCNGSFQPLKISVRDLYKSLQRIRNGENETRIFRINLRIAYEQLFKAATSQHPEFYAIKEAFPNRLNSRLPIRADLDLYKEKLQAFLTTNGLSNGIRRIYDNEGVLNNLRKGICNSMQRANTKDCIALLLIYAQENPHSPIADYVVRHANQFITVGDQVNEGNHENHSVSDRVYTSDQANAIYREFEEIFRSTYDTLIGDYNHGKE